MGKQFNWTTVGEELVPPAIRHEFLAKIRDAEWVETPAELPFMPGENIKEIVAQLGMPFPRQISYNLREFSPMGCYGIRSQYGNGFCELWALDLGSTCTPILSIFEPKDPTLTEALRARGLTHKRALDRARPGAHDVWNAAREVVFTGTADEVWAWLKTTVDH